MITNIVLLVSIVAIGGWIAWDYFQPMRWFDREGGVIEIEGDGVANRMEAITCIEHLIAWCEENENADVEYHVRQAGRALYEADVEQPYA